MQVSIACTEHNLKSRSSEDRLCSVRAGPPTGCSGTGGGGQGSNAHYLAQGQTKSRAMGGSRVAPQGHAHMKEAIGRHSSMKYR